MEPKFDVLLQRLREEDQGGGGSLPVGVRADYTAFEVVANDEAIPIGSTDVVIGGGTVSFGVTIGGTTHGIAEQIDVGMQHEMKILPLDGNGITVNWGDGNSNSYTSTADTDITASHTYTAAGKYTVKVYGRFCRICPTTGKNLTYRLLEADLPVADDHVSLWEFAKNSKRLVKVNFNEFYPGGRFNNLTRVFSGCSNLRAVYGMTRLTGVLSCSGLFQDCFKLITCEFKLPPLVLSVPGSADGYRNIFWSNTANAQWALTGDLNDFFPDCGFSGEIIDMSAMFYNCNNTNCYPNITLPAASAAKLAAKLWRSVGKKFLSYTWANDMPSGVRNLIPTAWGGLDSAVVVDPDTGVVPSGSGGMTVQTVTPSGSSVTVLPEGGVLYVVSGAIDSLQIGDLDTSETKEWGIIFEFSAGSSATVQIVLSGAQTKYETVGEFTFEAGKKYVISCQRGMLVRGERTEHEV